MKTLSFNYDKAETYQSFSKVTEVTETTYKGVKVTEKYVSPHFWGKKPYTVYIIDLVLPTDKYDNLNESMYTLEGYGTPVFDNRKDVIEFIDRYDSKDNEPTMTTFNSLAQS